MGLKWFYKQNHTSWYYSLSLYI